MSNSRPVNYTIKFLIVHQNKHYTEDAREFQSFKCSIAAITFPGSPQMNQMFDELSLRINHKLTKPIIIHRKAQRASMGIKSNREGQQSITLIPVKGIRSSSSGITTGHFSPASLNICSVSRY